MPGFVRRASLADWDVCRISASETDFSFHTGNTETERGEFGVHAFEIFKFFLYCFECAGDRTEAFLGIPAEDAEIFAKGRQILFGCGLIKAFMNRSELALYHSSEFAITSFGVLSSHFFHSKVLARAVKSVY